MVLRGERRTLCRLAQVFANFRTPGNFKAGSRGWCETSAGAGTSGHGGAVERVVRAGAREGGRRQQEEEETARRIHRLFPVECGLQLEETFLLTGEFLFQRFILAVEFRHGGGGVDR